mgnify:FL=1
MGVIYHRREPDAHVQTVAALTRPGGQVVIESIVVNQAAGFKPASRYARMRNVWWVPTVGELKGWMAEAGCTDITVADVSRTTTLEQRSTEWMRFDSLADALDPQDPEKTVEGYPAPTRAILVARKR